MRFWIEHFSCWIFKANSGSIFYSYPADEMERDGKRNDGADDSIQNNGQIIGTKAAKDKRKTATAESNLFNDWPKIMETGKMDL